LEPVEEGEFGLANVIALVLVFSSSPYLLPVLQTAEIGSFPSGS
jgi:hypothetical protein